MRETKRHILLETKLKRIEKLSEETPDLEYKWLIQHFSKENLISCFHELGRSKAVGVDGKSKDDYEENLEQNIESLIARMKSLKYYPAPVREVKIPKGNGKYRPLGISNIEDKIVQSMYAKILNAIYDPLFMRSSYGFRPKRSCHDAIKDVYQYLNKTDHVIILDVDLRNFFGTINHRKLIQILEIKIKDRTFIRYIVRMLRSGILADGELKKSAEGTPQGSIVSPILANIFAHYAIDRWIKGQVPQHLKGAMHIVRYADDFVIFTIEADAPKIMKALEGRLKRFSLEINVEKTKTISFSRSKHNRGEKQGVLDFLGFTFFFGQSRRGHTTVKLKTAGKTLAKKLKDLSLWCKINRNRYRLADLWETFTLKLRGHIQYYGVSHNFNGIGTFKYRATKIFFKWINRRSQRKSFNWEKFNLYMKSKPLPKLKIAHRLF